MLGRVAALAVVLLAVGCSGSNKDVRGACGDKVLCGAFDIAKSKESTPIFFAGAEQSPPYRLCVDEGSVIVQTIEADGNAQSIGVEVRAGNCADLTFADKVYIIGNTANGHSSGFYYRVP